MPQPPTSITDEIGIAFANLADAAAAPFTPTLRLGVTGLSRSGKTIFITALVHALLTGGRLPGFAPLTEGRFTVAWGCDEDLRRAGAVCSRYARLQMGWVDAMVMACAVRLQADAIATLDLRHFGAVAVPGRP